MVGLLALFLFLLLALSLRPFLGIQLPRSAAR
jgi:hypothetical protein